MAAQVHLPGAAACWGPARTVGSPNGIRPPIDSEDDDLERRAAVL